ncbi:hypothetical protein VNI00_009250 [Paramarasmius palmivorus]|uniref:Uncharacterized protein n=1 Tax=Paramarasmius palmivorus TaxID=297713 RepID=A0AAW0CRA3_9AGAR
MQDIASFEAQILTLKDKIRGLKWKRERFQSLKAPIRSLPSEILAKVLLYELRGDARRGSHFRTIKLGLITFDPTLPPSKILMKHIHYSRDALLQLGITACYKETPQSLSPLLDVQHRWGSLSFTSLFVPYRKPLEYFQFCSSESRLAVLLNHLRTII